MEFSLNGTEFSESGKSGKSHKHEKEKVNLKIRSVLLRQRGNGPKYSNPFNLLNLVKRFRSDSSEEPTVGLRKLSVAISLA